jgi:hypothetical protein
MRSRATVAVVAVTVALTEIVVGSQAQPAAPAAPSVAAKFLARSSASLQTYRAKRRLEGANKRFDKHGWLEVQTELGPAGFSYTVIGEGGAEVINGQPVTR